MDDRSTTSTINWRSVVMNGVLAVVIALVVGTLAYHFLADEVWGDAFRSSLLWAALAAFGAVVGTILAQVLTRSNRA